MTPSGSPSAGLPLAFSTLAATAILSLSPISAQSPSDADRPDREVVARFLVEGEPAFVSRLQVAEAFAQREFATARGKDAIEHLIDVRLVLTEAKAEGVLPDAVDVRARVEEMRGLMEQGGRSLETFLARSGHSFEEFCTEIVEPTIAHERLVMRALDLDSRNEVTPDLLQLWLSEARERHDVVTDPNVLPVETAARIDGQDLPRVEVGEILLRNAAADEYSRTVETLVLRRLIGAAARAAGVEITSTDLRAEVARRRRKAESNPEFEGLTFEELLATQGLDPETFANSPVLIAQLQEERIVDAIWTDDAVDAWIEEHRGEVLASHGPRRRFSVLLLRAREQPNELVPRTFEVATAEAKRFRAGIDGLADFAEAARRYSDEPGTKARGGDVGWRHRDAEGMPPILLEGAWNTPVGETSGPLQDEIGVWLVHVAAVEPQVEADELRERVRDERRRDWRDELIESASLEILPR